MITVEARTGTRRALLLPGADLRAAFYRPLLDRLAARGVTTTALTIGPDLARLGWPGLLDALHAAWDAHAGPDALLVGHSFGALCALLLAARRPAGLGRVALLEPAIAPTRRLAAWAAARYRRQALVRDRDGFVNRPGGFTRVARPERFPAGALALYLAARREDDPAPLGALLEAAAPLHPPPAPGVPVVVVRGARSGWQPRLGAWLLARRLGARLVTIPGAAHWLANEADEEVATAISPDG